MLPVGPFGGKTKPGCFKPYVSLPCALTSLEEWARRVLLTILRYAKMNLGLDTVILQEKDNIGH